MAGGKIDTSKLPVRMEGSYKSEEFVLLRAVVDEGISCQTRMSIEFASPNRFTQA